MRRLQHNAAAGAVAVDSLQLVTAELAEEVGARQVHRAVAVFRRYFALGLLAHAQNRVEQKRERREARDEQHSGCARLRLARRRSSVDQAHARACFSLQSLQSTCRLCSSSLRYCTYFARATASVIFSAACAPAFFRDAKSGRRKLLVPRRSGTVAGAPASAAAGAVRPPSRAGAARLHTQLQLFGAGAW